MKNIGKRIWEQSDSLKRVTGIALMALKFCRIGTISIVVGGGITIHGIAG